MSDQETILKFVKEELLETDQNIDINTSLFRSQLLDSVNMSELIVFLEEHFKIPVGAMDISDDNFDTVVCVMEFIERKRAAQ